MTTVAAIGDRRSLTISAFFAVLASANEVLQFSEIGDRFSELWYEVMYQIAFENQIRIREVDCRSAIEVFEAAGVSTAALAEVREASKKLAYDMMFKEVMSLPRNTLLGPASRRYLREFEAEVSRLKKAGARSK
jgi:hypothetical protein